MLLAGARPAGSSVSKTGGAVRIQRKRGADHTTPTSPSPQTAPPSGRQPTPNLGQTAPVPQFLAHRAGLWAGCVSTKADCQHGRLLLPCCWDRRHWTAAVEGVGPPLE